MAKESSFGLPHGEKETPQLRNRFENYKKHMKKTGGWGFAKDEERLHKKNSFYEFNKPQYDSKHKPKAIKRALSKAEESEDLGKMTRKMYPQESENKISKGNVKKVEQRIKKDEGI